MTAYSTNVYIQHQCGLNHSAGLFHMVVATYEQQGQLVSVSVDEGSVASLNAYMNQSSLLQKALFPSKPGTLRSVNHRWPCTFKGGKED